MIYQRTENFNLRDSLISDSVATTESDLIRAWEQIDSGTRMTTTDGKLVLVIAPGKRNRHAGPDFLNACIYYNGDLITGAVECHLQEQGWFQHGHDGDHNYDNVILHLIGKPVRGTQRLKLPTVVLSNDYVHRTCSLTASQLDPLYDQILAVFAQQRWQEKIQRFLPVIAVLNPQPDKLIVPVLEVLGYGGNRVMFARLGEKISHFDLNGKSIDFISKLLFRTAQLGNPNWQRCGIRPASHPEQRLRLAVRLLFFIYQSVWFRRGLDQFQRDWDRMIRPFTGQGIQSELLGNYFYPLLAAQAIVSKDPALLMLIRQDWQNLRIPYGYGFLNRRFGAILPRKTLASFANLQGLKWINKNYCKPGNCQVCPLKMIYVCN